MNNKLMKLKECKEYKRLEEYYSKCTIFDQIGLFRFEDFHTNFLQSLFSLDNLYGLGVLPIQRFLELISNKGGNLALFDYAQLKDADFNDLDVKVQVCKGSNKVDMVISFSGYQIVLENKLLSFEHDSQCKKYYKSFKHDKCTFVYLSLEEHPTLSDKHFISITYQELVTFVIEPCLEKERLRDTKLLGLADYLYSFSKIIDLIDLSIQKKPLTSKEKEYTLNLYEQYSSVLKDILKENLVRDWISENILRMVYYNLFLIGNIDETFDRLIEERVLRLYRCTFNGEKVSYKDCGILIFKYLISQHIVQDEKDLALLNGCIKNKNRYLVATTNPMEERILDKNLYTSDDKLLLCGQKLYYYCGPVTFIELKYYYEQVNKHFDNILVNIVKIKE